MLGRLLLEHRRETGVGEDPFRVIEKTRGALLAGTRREASRSDRASDGGPDRAGDGRTAAPGPPARRPQCRLHAGGDCRGHHADVGLRRFSRSPERALRGQGSVRRAAG